MKLTDHIHALKIPFQITLSPEVVVPRYVYQYIIEGDKIILVDTGVKGAESVTEEYLRSQGWDWSDVSAVILTHSHPDHIGAALPVQKNSWCEIWSHPAEQNWIEDVELQYSQRPVPGFADLVAGSVKVDRLLDDGETIKCENGLDIEVIHTPGHSAGSISLFSPEEGVLLTGDVVPQPGSMPIYEDVTASARSIRRLMDISGIKILLSSWDDPRSGEEAYQSLRAGLGYLKTIHEAVMRAKYETYSSDPMELCRSVVDDLGLPPFTANPLVARSIAAHLRVENEAVLESLFRS